MILEKELKCNMERLASPVSANKAWLWLGSVLAVEAWKNSWIPAGSVFNKLKV